MLSRASLSQESALVRRILRELSGCGTYTRRLSSSSSSTSHLTATPPKLKDRKRSACVYSFLAGAVGSLGLTYYIWSIIKDQNKKVKLGSANDFQIAVRILCMTFPEDGRVTTEPDDLYDHGFSDNDYHPGML